eukprot:scaffold13889_cov178-Amphora_coffeaeformis.AAC.7
MHIESDSDNIEFAIHCFRPLDPFGIGRLTLNINVCSPRKKSKVIIRTWQLSWPPESFASKACDDRHHQGANHKCIQQYRRGEDKRPLEKHWTRTEQE